MSSTRVTVGRLRAAASDALRRTRGLAAGLALAAIGAVLLASDFGADLEEDLGLQWLFDLRGPVRPPDEVVIVAIDPQSSRALGLPEKPRDWPRDLHAQLVRHLAAAGARVISFDLTFDAPGASAAADEALAAAMARAGNVLVTDALRKETTAIRDAGGALIGSATIERPAPPIESIERAVAAHAPFLLPKGPRVDAYWTFKSSAGDAPTVPVLAFSLYAGPALDELAEVLQPAKGPPITLDAQPGLSPAERLVHRARGLRDAAIAEPDAARRAMERLVSRTDLQPAHRAMLEALVRLYTAPEMSHLNFYGPAGTIRTLPYGDVLQAARAASAVAGAPDGWRGKAVFIGFAASEGSGGTARDDYRTVYSEPSGRDIAGVEIQATAFANALQGRALTRPPVAAQLAAVVAWGLLIGFLCRRLRPPTSVIVAAALCACFGWAVYRRFDAAAEWWPSVVPLAVQMPIALFGGVFAIYRETRREREAVKRAFGQFLPGSVVEQLARNVGAVTASNRVVYGACLASDAEKYTTLAEQTEPGRLGELMNAYYADLFVPVERTGGVVIDVVGDAMVAIWAGSTAQAELRLGACESAIEILAALDRAVAEGRSTLPTRIGLHAGEMLIGSIGASRHFEYRAVGDIVNTASRIQALNKTLGTRALATEATVAGLDGIVARPLGHFLLPGKLTAVAVVELLGLRETVDAATRERAAAFAKVLECHAQRRWQEAVEHLDALLAATPDDGPAHFYRRRCEQLLRVASDDAWTPTIRVDVK